MELSKSDKRLCRELINTGLERECRHFVEQIQRIAREPIPPEQLNEPTVRRTVKVSNECGTNASPSCSEPPTNSTITWLAATTMSQAPTTSIALQSCTLTNG